MDDADEPEMLFGGGGSRRAAPVYLSPVHPIRVMLQLSDRCHINPDGCHINPERYPHQECHNTVRYSAIL